MIPAGNFLSFLNGKECGPHNYKFSWLGSVEIGDLMLETGTFLFYFCTLCNHIDGSTVTVLNYG